MPGSCPVLLQGSPTTGHRVTKVTERPALSHSKSIAYIYRRDGSPFALSDGTTHADFADARRCRGAWGCGFSGGLPPMEKPEPCVRRPGGGGRPIHHPSHGTGRGRGTAGGRGSSELFSKDRRSSSDGTHVFVGRGQARAGARGDSELPAVAPAFRQRPRSIGT